MSRMSLRILPANFHIYYHAVITVLSFLLWYRWEFFSFSAFYLLVQSLESDIHQSLDFIHLTELNPSLLQTCVQRICQGTRRWLPKNHLAALLKSNQSSALIFSRYFIYCTLVCSEWMSIAWFLENMNSLYPFLCVDQPINPGSIRRIPRGVLFLHADRDTRDGISGSDQHDSSLW